MTDLRHVWDQRIRDWPTVRKIAIDLGLTGKGHHFYCPGCQPLCTGTPELAIGEGHFECFRCNARGDVVGLVKLARKCDLEAAIAWLARETGEQSPRAVIGGTTPLEPQTGWPAVFTDSPCGRSRLPLSSRLP